jgi:hypothetical protein
MSIPALLLKLRARIATLPVADKNRFGLFFVLDKEDRNQTA